MTKSIGLKTPRGNYTSYSKVFKDEKHFNNWVAYMTREGYKIISIL